TRAALLGANVVAASKRRAMFAGKTDLAARLLRSPGGAAAKGLVVMHQALKDPALRRLLMAYARDRQLRHAIRLGDLLGDLLRLSIVRSIKGGGRNSQEIGFRIESRYDSADATLTILSSPVDHRFEESRPDWSALEERGGEIGSGPLCRIVW